MNTGYILSAAALQVVAAHGRDDGERLAKLVRQLPAHERKRFMPAARQAGYGLEWLKPAIAGPTDHGLLAGCFSKAMPGEVVIVCASANRSLAAAVRVAEIGELLQAVERHLVEHDDPVVTRAWASPGGFMTLAACTNLNEHGRDAREGMPGECSSLPLLGAVLRQPEAANFARRVSRAGSVPALVCLLSRRRDGAVLLPLVHGKPWPVLQLGEVAGAA